MNLWPVIRRELRLQARRPLNYRLRVAAAAIVIVALEIQSLLAIRSLTPMAGQVLFRDLCFLIYYGMWLFVPFLTCDSISREKREGTLGLLALTDLSPVGIVLGKAFAHGCRAAAMLLAVYPVLAIPLLLGGVTGGMIVEMFLWQLGTLLLSLVIGLFASSTTQKWSSGVVLTSIWVFLVGSAHFRVSIWAFASGSLNGMVVFFAASVCVSALLIGAAARRVRINWKDTPPSMRQIWWLRTFCSPRFWKSIFRRSMRRHLDRNPIGWLQYYSTGSRLAKWVWCLLAVIWQVAAVSGPLYGQAALGLAVLLSLGLAVSAAGSFRRERENRALELILVSPVRPAEILYGRLRGLWNQFFPAVCVLALPWIWISLAFDVREFMQVAIVIGSVGLTTFLTLPCVGLYFSLRMRVFIGSLLATVALGMGCPALIFLAVLTLPRFGDEIGAASLVAAAFQIVVAGASLVLSKNRLRDRSALAEQF